MLQADTRLHLNAGYTPKCRLMLFVVPTRAFNHVLVNAVVAVHGIRLLFVSLILLLLQSVFEPSPVAGIRRLFVRSHRWCCDPAVEAVSVVILITRARIFVHKEQSVCPRRKNSAQTETVCLRREKREDVWC